jgi:hypothetical protein
MKTTTLIDLVTNATDNWHSHSGIGPAADFDRARTLASLLRRANNQALKETAADALQSIRAIDQVIDEKEYEACSDYRRQAVKTYNTCRYELQERTKRGQYKGELLEVLDNIKGVRV